MGSGGEGVGDVGSMFQDLLEQVLLPLHTPNAMVEWRDQVPVVQVRDNHDLLND